MKQHHEDFLHFATCLGRLNSALRTLLAIKAAGGSPLVGPAFRFALVEYATPYTRSDGPIKKDHRLKTSFVPGDLLELHNRLLDARNKIHAHADLTPMEAKLYVTTTRGAPSVEITSRNADELKELDNIDEIIRLIEGTILNMYAELDVRVRTLQP